MDQLLKIKVDFILLEPHHCFILEDLEQWWKMNKAQKLSQNFIIFLK